MGLFDVFARSGPAALKKHAARTANKRAQQPDRWESIQALAGMKSADSVAALLERFRFTIDPTITDREEKEAAFEGIVETGAPAVEPVRTFMKHNDSISWPVKILEKLLTREELLNELLSVLESLDTEYERDPEKKIQVLSYLSEHKSPRILPQVLRFLSDRDDTARYQAAAALFAQDDAEQARQPLLDALLSDESVRNRSQILDGFIARSWDAGDQVESLKPKLPRNYTVDKTGKLKKG